jgi:DivIVA domain-containing protein
MTSSGPITGDEVRGAIFRKPPLGKRGYDRDQVDAFLQRVAAALDGSDSLTEAEVHNVVFGKPTRMLDRGYDEEDVDALLDIVGSILGRRAGLAPNPPAADASAPSFTAAPRTEPLSGYQVRQTVLKNSPIGRPGYDKQQVDEFVERAANTLDGSGLPLSMDQVRQAGFSHPKGLHRGYDVDDVHALLDRITAELRRRSAGW